MRRKYHARRMSAEEEKSDERMRQAINPDGQIRVLLPSGAMATVAPDVSLKTLMALDEMAALVIRSSYVSQEKRETRYDVSAEHDAENAGG